MTTDPLKKAAPVVVENPDPITVALAMPAAVVVENPDPIVVAMAPELTTASQDKAAVVSAKASVDAEVLTREGQRHTSLIWERTQQVIALSVVMVTLVVAAYSAMTSLDDASAFTLLASLANLVIGFYFGRTNHTRVGGPGGETRSEGR